MAVIPFEQIDHLIYLPVSVNGSKLRFVLDGGSSVFVIDSSKVKQLSLNTAGKGKIQGAGSGSVDVTYTDSITYNLNVIKITIPKSTIINLTNAIPGQKIDGIVGFDLFDKYVVEINYHANTLRLFDPKSFFYSGSGSRIPITIKRKLIYAHAKVKVAGHTPEVHEFVIDSGSSDNVDDDLIAKSTSPKTEGNGGVGLGQTFKVKVGYIESFQIGKYVVKNIKGISGAEVIGNGFLHNYTVFFDYSRKQIILE
ncbi:MAG TPA: retropepsin-like aspartic protease [Puia sp.]|nr:retropepsin-like aspartic protease [Puia sp.]